MYDLKSTRKAKGLTGEVVCQAVKCSQSTLSLLETGKRRPSVDLAKRLGAVLGFDWILFFADDTDISQDAMEIDNDGITTARCRPATGEEM